jgi:hypothetical protein
MRDRALGLLLFGAALLSQCAKTGQEIEILSVTGAETALLGKEVVFDDVGLGFRPPKSWRTDSAAAIPESTLGTFSGRPKALFSRDDGAVFCMVSRVVSVEASVPDDPLGAYVGIVAGKFSGSDSVSYKNLRINRLPAVLFRITQKETLIYKFVVGSGDGCFQIDFACPASEFTDDVVRKMRSSVSTIRLAPGLPG